MKKGKKRFKKNSITKVLVSTFSGQAKKMVPSKGVEAVSGLSFVCLQKNSWKNTRPAPFAHRLLGGMLWLTVTTHIPRQKGIEVRLREECT